MKRFAQRKVIRRDVLLPSWKSLFSHRKLVHQRETNMVLPAGEIHTRKAPGKSLARLPANLLAQPRLITGRLHIAKLLHESEQHRLDKVPILRSAGEQSAQP